MVVLALPRYAAFKSKFNSKYLSYRKDDKYLCFSGDNALNPEAKFAIEPESSGNGQVHVRSCYNNKYFVRNSSQFLIAGAAKPDEDTLNETCTLLEPLAVNDGDTSTIRLRHVQSDTYACLFNATSDDEHTNACLCAISQSPDSDFCDAYEVIDWESLVIFPTNDITFKRSDGSYLGGVFAVYNYLQFSVGYKNLEIASYRVEPVGDGSVQIYSNYFKSYWSNSEPWILANRTEKSPNDPKALFWPVKLGSNVIALRSLDNNRFLRGLTAAVVIQSLAAYEKTITDDCHIMVEELVISRSIYNIVYRQDDARVYNENPIVCGKVVATNNSDEQDTIEMSIKYIEAKSTSWGNSVSLEVGLSTIIETRVPFIAEGRIDFSASVTAHTWGGTKDESFGAELVTYTATVGPKTHVEVSYVTTKGTCDIPFSYTQSDTYSDGSREITVKNDGMFTGVNCYNYSFDKKETPIE